MLRTITSTAAMLIALSGAAFAETFEVQMLNRGDAGKMIFEPSSLRISPGDTVKFLAIDRAHNAESIKGMIPDGATPFAGRINEEIEVTFDTEGFYGIKCKPHFSLGMVMVIAVGEGEAPQEGFMDVRLAPKAKKRFQEQLEAL